MYTITCQSYSLEEFDIRYISKEISCNNYNECFSKVDSLFNSGLKKSLTWTKLSRADSLIEFVDYASTTEYVTILVIDNIEVGTDQGKLIRLGSDDGIRVFVNGEEVFRHAVGRGIQADSDWIPVSLRKGANQLIFQVNQGSGNWALHYKIDDFENITNLFVEQAFELYRDLPEAYILSDEDTTVGLKIDPRTKLDSYNTISFSWKTRQGKTLKEASFLGSELPNALTIPRHEPSLILEYEVLNTSEIIYSEQTPFFHDSFVTTTVPELLQNNSLHPKWIEGLQSVFEQEFLEEPTRYYSTRVKAEFLWDVLNELESYEYQIAGARTELFNNELARRYIPQRPSGNKIVGMHLDFLESVQQYFDTNVGRVHFLMTQWNGYAQYYGAEFFFPFISNEIEEYSTNNVLDAYESAHSDSFSVVVWSKIQQPFLKR